MSKTYDFTGVVGAPWAHDFLTSIASRNARQGNARLDRDNAILEQFRAGEITETEAHRLLDEPYEILAQTPSP